MVKLGQQIRFKNERKLKTENRGVVVVKSGDTARVTKKIDDETAEIVYITGEAKGLCQRIPLKVDDNIDVDDIAKKILDEINHN